MLLEKYGKNYVSELGFSDFAAAVASVSGVSVAKNFIVEDSKKAAAVKKPAEKIPEPEQETVEENAVQKPEINAVKRDIFAFVAQHDNSVPMPKLGAFLTKKYGRGFIKELGFPTMKKLAASISGVKEKRNVLSLEEDFVKRTEEIEQFVYDFAHGEGKCSIKALSGKIRKRFANFDFTDYGYTKFSDFINAIDGVRANGYYVEADD